MVGWICTRCDKMRKTNYCPDCGSQAPLKGEIEADVNALRVALRHHRALQTRLYNQARTIEERHVRYNTEKIKASSEKNRQVADGLEFALKIIGQSNLLLEEQPTALGGYK